MVGVLWYMTNAAIHKDIKKGTVFQFSTFYESRLHRHNNVEALQLLDVPTNRTLVRISSFEIGSTRH